MDPKMRRARTSMRVEAKDHFASAWCERIRLVFVHGCAATAPTAAAWALTARALVRDSNLSALWIASSGVPLWGIAGVVLIYLDWCWPQADGPVRRMLVWGFAVGFVAVIAAIAVLTAIFVVPDTATAGGATGDKLGISLGAAIAMATSMRAHFQS